MMLKTLQNSLKRPILIGISVGIVTAVITLFLPNHYTSEARILPSQPGTRGLGQFSAAAAALGIGFESGNSDSLYPDILKSRWVAERLLTHAYTFHMKRFYFDQPQPYTQTLLEQRHAKNLDQGIQSLSAILNVKQDPKTSLLTLEVTTTSPELSQQVCRLAVSLLSDYLITEGRTKGSDKADFAAQRLEEARKERSTAEAAFRNFLIANRNYQSSQDPDIRLKGVKLEAELQLRT